MASRDYAPLVRAAAESLQGGTGVEERMSFVVNALWEAFARSGVSWVGFYLPGDSGNELLLGHRRDRPACSPIGLHGVCGRAFRERTPVVVGDVADLGPDYIACDPRDRSEVVVPLLGPEGECTAVLDLDSHQVGSFDESDVAGLRDLLKAAGLTFPA